LNGANNNGIVVVNVTGNPPTPTPLTFACFGTNISAILTDGGNGAQTTGDFSMQPGVYQIEFHAPLFSCPGTAVQVTIDNAVVEQWESSNLSFGFPGDLQTPCSTTFINGHQVLSFNVGIIAGAIITSFGSNQILRFPSFSATFGAQVVPGTNLVPGNNTVTALLITKLQ
jgi:hypothetical protein